MKLVSNSERFGEKESVWHWKSRPKTQIFFSKWELIWLIIQESYKLRERVKVIGRFVKDYNILCNLQITVLSSKSDVTCRYYNQVYEKNHIV